MLEFSSVTLTCAFIHGSTMDIFPKKTPTYYGAVDSQMRFDYL